MPTSFVDDSWKYWEVVDRPKTSTDSDGFLSVAKIVRGVDNNDSESKVGSDPPKPPVLTKRFNKVLEDHQLKGQWVTMPADGPEGSGSPVYIDDAGKIAKGPAELEGKKPSELSKKKKPPPKAPKIKPSKPLSEAPKAEVESPKGQSKTPDYVGKPLNIMDDPDPPVFLKKHDDYLVSYVDDDEFKAIVYYTATGYKELNKQMRSCPPKFKCLDAEQKKHLKLIEKTITEAPKLPEPITVYRGIEAGLDAIKVLLDSAQDCLKNDREYRMPSLTSTSISPNAAAQFGSAGDRTLFQIKAKSGLYVESISANKGEKELLQSANTKYRVIAIEDAPLAGNEYVEGKKAKIIYLEEV